MGYSRYYFVIGGRLVLVHLHGYMYIHVDVRVWGHCNSIPYLLISCSNSCDISDREYSMIDVCSLIIMQLP